MEETNDKKNFNKIRKYRLCQRVMSTMGKKSSRIREIESLLGREAYRESEQKPKRTKGEAHG